MAAALSIRHEIMVITLTARKMWCRPWGWWEPLLECWGTPPSSLGKVPPSWQVTLRTPWEWRIFRKSSASPVGLGLGAQEMHALCVPITSGSYNCSVSSVHRSAKLVTAFERKRKSFLNVHVNYKCILILEESSCFLRSVS